MTAPAPNRGLLLDTKAVMERYGYCDPRAARAVMRQAGGFALPCGQLRCWESDLDAWEAAQRVVDTQPERIKHSSMNRRCSSPRADVPDKLEPGWWNA